MIVNRRTIGLSFLALVLILLCVRASIWQFDRYQIRHESNQLIQHNLSKPVIGESQLANNPSSIAWRTITITGAFVPKNEILVRGRYHQDVYGYAVVTLFRSESGKYYWVDRGWVRAGADAKTAPATQAVTGEQLSITGRVRVESLERQVSGALFALSNGRGTSTLAHWNQEKSIGTQPVYIDLIKTSNSKFNPAFPSEVPTLSDGPHLSYSFQWLLFAGFVIFGWVLIMREERRQAKR